MNKKGLSNQQIFLLIGFFLSLLVFFANKGITDSSSGDSLYPGQQGLSLIEDDQDLNFEIVSYMKGVFLIRGKESILELADRGGIRSEDVGGGNWLSESKCSSECGYALWNRKEEMCFAEDVEGVFGEMVSEKMKGDVKKLEGFLKYRGVTQGSFLRYDYFVFENEAWGVSVSPIVYESVYPSDRRLVLRPDFKVDLGYNFKEYDELGGYATQIIVECKGKGEVCVTEMIKEFAGKGFEWKIDECEEKVDEGFVFFSVTSKDKIAVFDEKDYKVKEVPVVYRFGLWV